LFDVHSSKSLVSNLGSNNFVPKNILRRPRIDNEVPKSRRPRFAWRELTDFKSSNHLFEFDFYELKLAQRTLFGYLSIFNCFHNSIIGIL